MNAENINSKANTAPGRKKKSRLKWLWLSPLTLLFSLLVVLLVSLFWLGYTSYGTKTVVNLASRFVPELDMEGVSGVLLSDLKIQRITWLKDELEIRVTNAELDTSPFPPRIVIHKLSAKRITLDLPQTEKPQPREPFVVQLPEINIPIDLVLEDIDVDELHIKQGEALIKLREVKLSGLVDKDDTLKLDNLSGTLYDDEGDLAVSARGKLGLASPHAVDLAFNVSGDSQRYGVGNANLMAKGKVIDYRLNVDGAWTYGSYPQYQLQLKGEGNLEQLDVTALDLNGAAGSAHMQGIMSWSPQLQWKLELTGDDLNPGAFLQELPGNLDMVWESTGSLEDVAKVQLRLKSLSGKLQDYPVQADMLLNIEGEKARLESMNAAVGDNKLDATGSANESLELLWQLDAPDLQQLYPALNGKLEGKGKITGKRDGSQFQLAIETLQGLVLDYPLRAQGSAGIDGELLSAEDLKISVGDNHIILNGRADEAQGIDWSLDAKKLSQLAPELKGSLKGSGKATGKLDGSRGALQIDELRGKVLDYPVQGKGKLSYQDQEVMADNLQLQLGQNALQLNGDTASTLNWQLDARNLKQLHPDVTGFLKGNGQASAKLDGSAFKLHIAQLAGKIDERPVNAKGDIELSNQIISIKDLVMRAGENRLNASGKASEPFDLSFAVDAPRLSQVWPGLGGALKGSGALKGTWEKPRVDLSLDGKKLKFQDTRLSSMRLSAKQEGEIYTIEADVKELQQADNTIKSAKLDAKGSIDKHTINLDVAHQDGKLALQASGGYRNEQWQGQLSKLNLSDTPAGDWRLTQPVQLSASARAFDTSRLCLNNQQAARLCADTQWSKDSGLKSKGGLQRIPLAMASPWLPDTIKTPGVANADFDISLSPDGKPGGKIKLALPDSSITITNKRGRAETVYYRDTRADVSIDNRRAKLTAGADLRDRGTIGVEGVIDLADQPQQSRLDGAIKLQVPDIRWMQQFSNDIDELKGKLTGDVRIQGTLAKPQVTGAAKLQNASLFLPETSARLEAINLTAQANRADQMTINGSLKAGNGMLNANGTLFLANLPDWNAVLKLKGDRLLLMNTHEVQAQVSPDLDIKATAKAVNITGRLYVPETSVTLRELPTSAKSRSDDIVIIGGKTGKAESNSAKANDGVLDIKPNVVVELGDKVSFSGFGFDARLTGKLRLLRTRQDIVAQGNLNVEDGIYEAYGQELEIERGRMIFDGPLDNPGLDIRAIRRVPGDITVGIALRGTAQNPESELFSSPQQTQTDTLSYLLTGRSLSNTSSGDSAILSKAVTGLGIKGGESLAQQLGSQLGIDVGLDTSNGDYRQSELALGKRIGARLYVKYIVGLFDSLQKIAVTYQINKRLELEARSGIEQQSVDLNYKIETNKGLFGP